MKTTEFAPFSDHPDSLPIFTTDCTERYYRGKCDCEDSPAAETDY